MSDAIRAGGIDNRLGVFRWYKALGNSWEKAAVLSIVSLQLEDCLPLH